MESKKEQALVGIFVIVAIAILLIAMFSISGTFRSSGNKYLAFFKNAGGLQEGGQVRYAGGPPIGRILSVKPDPKNVAQMQIEFRVEPDVPVKKDSTVKISSLSALGENFLLIVPGSQGAPLAQNGDDHSDRPLHQPRRHRSHHRRPRPASQDINRESERPRRRIKGNHRRRQRLAQCPESRKYSRGNVQRQQDA